MSSHVITVIGGSNVDISATSQASVIPGDSNPGAIQLGFGGVGRNIAENLVRLSQDVQLITAYGDDSFSTLLQAQAAEIGLDISMSLQKAQGASSVYVCVNQPDGEMIMAVSDMEICNWVTPDHLMAHWDTILKSELVIMDTNLPEDTILYIAKNCKAPLFAETVSTKKVIRLKSALHMLQGIKTNRSEAELLVGFPIRTVEDAKSAAMILHDMGVSIVMITMGSHGALIKDSKKLCWMPPMLNTFINTTGCGDAFFAGAAYAWLEGLNCLSMLRYGLGMAALCAADRNSVASGVSPRSLDMFLYYHQEEEN